MRNQCPMKEPPCAKGWPLLGVLPSLWFDVIAAFRRMRGRHGDVVRFKLPHETAYLISCPALVREVLVRSEFTKGGYYQRLETAFGQGLLTAKGETWRRQRKLLQPFFQLDKIKAWQPIVNHNTDEMLERWEGAGARGDEVDAIAEMRELLQHIMSQIMFGSELPRDLAIRAAEAISTVNDNILAELLRASLLRGPLKCVRTPGMKRYRQAIEEFDATIDQCLAHAGESNGDHMLAHFRRARHADTGAPMDAKQFRDEVATFFFAGQETTANALGWVFHFLSQHPHVADKVADEAAARNISSDSGYDAFNALSYAQNVINETLRLRPPAYAIERHVDEDVELGGYRIDAHSMLVVAPGVVHRHPDYWEDPDSFRPERFDGSQANAHRPDAFFPFGGGARKCIGMQLAMMEMTTIAALACSRFQFALKPGAKVKARIGLTQQPHPSIPLKLSKRVIHEEAVSTAEEKL